MLTIISFFQKSIKGGVGIRAGGLEHSSKINRRGGGRLFGTREYKLILNLNYIFSKHAIEKHSLSSLVLINA